MLGEIVGYCKIKSDPKTGTSTIPLSKFAGKICRVLEFSEHDGSALVLDPEATALGMAVDRVYQHWRSIVDGKVPFGFTVKDEQ